ncbi:MAG TPA: Zn-ribbon domain-containing OB-fold protein [Anaerolineales bacterium]|nr:Zn-ribbon domain-containing OB-fold protein [Anaerolineales bacterium]
MAEETTPLPFSAASFDRYITDHKLMAARCKTCGDVYVPPRAICPGCQSESLEWTETLGKGRLAAFTVIYSGPTFMIEQGFDRKNPYVSGIVELEEGPRISARILGVDPTQPSDIRIGTPMTLDFVEFGEGQAKKTYLAFRV